MTQPSNNPAGKSKNPRDARGWRIPKEGTLSHKVYLTLIVAATADPPRRIYPASEAKRLGMTYNNFCTLVYKIKHPDLANLHSTQWTRRKREEKALTVKKRRKIDPYIQKIMDCCGVGEVKAIEMAADADRRVAERAKRLNERRTAA